MFSLLFMMESMFIDDAFSGNSWIMTMQEEFNQFQHNHVSDFVPQPKGKNIKWKSRILDKLHQLGEVLRNKARLTSQDYNQQ